MDLAAELAKFGPGAPAGSLPLAEAQGYCRRLAQSHYENFTVASRLFPRHLRQHLCHVYAYCRWADDLADEAASPEQSLALLDWWGQQLDAMFAHQSPDQWSGCAANSRSPAAAPRPMVGALTPPAHPVFVALRETVREFGLPRQPLADLLTAFRRDQVQTRYETMDELLGYCRCSANPVGRIVLALGRVVDEELVALSDQVCTGLQLANFCQDVRRDRERGRIYLPQEDCRRRGWDEARFTMGRCDDDFRQLLAPIVLQADSLLAAGQVLARRVPPELRLAVRVFADGGRAILAAIRQSRYDVWARRPTVGRWTKLRLLARAWWSG